MKKIKFAVNEKLFPLEAILTASYGFIDAYYLYIDKKGNNLWVSLEPKDETNFNLKPRDVEGQFRNELLHDTLRIKISQNNAEIREYIISQALSSALPVDENKNIISKENYLDDPLGIAVPWEEKFNQQEAPVKIEKKSIPAKKNAKLKKKLKKSKN